MTIKAQALADFIVEFTLPDPDKETEYWTIYADDSSVTGINEYKEKEKRMKRYLKLTS